MGIRCSDHVTSSTRKSRHYFAASGGRSVGIVRLRTKATEFSLVLVLCVDVLSVSAEQQVPSAQHLIHLIICS
jgi:hypothetical protein